MSKISNMKHKSKQIVLFVISLAVGLVFWNISISNADDLLCNYRTLSFRFQNKDIKTNDLIDTNIKDIPYVLWKSAGNQKIKGVNFYSDNNYNEGINTDVIYLLGENNSLNLHENSCALSETKSYELFNSSDVVGKEIKINDEIYVISQILMGNSNIIVAYGNENMSYSSLEADLSYVDEYRRTELSNVDLGAEYVTIPYDSFSKLAVNIALIPAVAVGILVLLKITRLIKTSKSSFTNLIILLMWITGIGIILKIFGFYIDISQSIIPTRWSDFEFWQTAFRNTYNKILQIKFMKIYYSDIYFRLNFSKILMTSAVSSTAFVFGFKQIKFEKQRTI